MQRPIKFRAWIRTEKRIVSVSNLRFIDGVVSIAYGGDFHVYYNQEEIELMQFTSLKDKNGKEIWEGDIVLNHNEKFEVVFEKGGFNLKKKGSFQTPTGHWLSNSFHISSYSEKVMHVIGNIYENPELLEGGNP
jgi:uncharacterized phage protein (TIGR01671 family)